MKLTMRDTKKEMLTKFDVYSSNKKVELESLKRKLVSKKRHLHFCHKELNRKNAELKAFKWLTFGLGIVIGYLITLI